MVHRRRGSVEFQYSVFIITETSFYLHISIVISFQDLFLCFRLNGDCLDMLHVHDFFKPIILTFDNVPTLD